MTGSGASPVFVVGAPRSGTTLLAAMLAAHPSFDCGPETFCLWRWSRLGRQGRMRVLDPATWPEGGTAFVSSLRMPRGDRPIHELYGLSRDDLRAWLDRRPPSLAHLLESLTAQRAERSEKPRWVEKTPRHLETLALIRETWPEARIVRVVRDPRDAAVSLARVPFGTPSLVTNLSALARMADAARPFFEVDQASMTLRYEDLVVEPEWHLRALCAFLGETYQPAMVEGRGAAAGVAAAHEWWKGDVTGPLDPSRMGTWRREMPEEVQRYAALNLADVLSEHDYEGGRTSRRVITIVPPGDALSARYDPMLLRLAADDVAVERPVPRTAIALARRRQLVFFGVGGQLDPDRQGSAGHRAGNLLALAALLAWRRLTGRPVPWVARLTLLPRRRRDAGERVLVRLLQLLARRGEAEALPDLARDP